MHEVYYISVIEFAALLQRCSPGSIFDISRRYVRCEWEVGRLDVRGRLERGGGPERGGGAAGVDGGRHGRRQRSRLRGDEGAEVSAGVAERDGGARAEGGLPEQGEVDAWKVQG